MARTKQQLTPIHPGEILWEEFMQPMGLSINRLARDLHVPPTRVHAIVHGERGISADTALRLEAYFGVSAETWIALQANHDLRVARRESGEAVRKSVRKREAA
ncbi:MAG: HigA family addiction module antidote protein [Bryobacteraceae bacterium]|nr:HigA family addiction module antidote protein [Bryobacteraceae bacterium]